MDLPSLARVNTDAFTRSVIWAAATANGQGSVCVWVRSDAFKKHGCCIHGDTTIAEVRKKGKNKIAHISGFIESRFPFQYGIVAFPYRRIVGQQIRAYRKQAGLSQEKLAEKASLSYKYLGEVERGYVNVSLDSLMRIAKALRVKVSDLTRDI